MARAGKLVRYTTVSAISTTTSLVILSVLVATRSVHALVANFIATAVGTIPSFELNRRWVWRKSGSRSIAREIGPFCALSFAGLALSTFAVGVADHAANSAHLASAVRTLLLDAANFGSFGSLWVAQFVILDKVLFHRQGRSSFRATELAPVARGNGHAVGHVNGNGHSNGNGHANGNGHSNGNGHANGNGLTNGNGNGHSNGHGTTLLPGDDLLPMLASLEARANIGSTLRALPTPVPTRDHGVAVVMPAYLEEANLSATVNDFLTTLEQSGHEHCIVIVNDGSTDKTGLVAELLRLDNPGRVRVVHHIGNKGYGAAVRTGIQEALDETNLGNIFLTDSDGQFRADQLPQFLQEARDERADVVIGYREHRADPLVRKLNAWLWTKATRLLLRTDSRDVDCAYKLIDRDIISDLELHGDAAVISPELLSKLRTRGARVIERPVRHYPRQYGEPSGADLSVIMRSLRGLISMAREQWRAHRLVRKATQGYDPVLRGVTLGSIVASAATYLYFLVRHQTLAYPDAVSHLLIARRVASGTPSGLAQLGGVWLPLPHLLALPGIWNRTLFYSGFAGSIVSMAAYVLATRYLYRIGLGITRSRVAGVVGAGVFAFNPNILYMQATPMTEVVLLACIAGAIYYLMCWQTTRSHLDLTKTSIAVMLATLTRYEAWVLLPVIAVVVGYTARRHGRAYAVESNLLFYFFLAASGVVAWVIWNAVIFQNAFYFQTGRFAKPSLWVSHSEKAIGNWSVSFKTFAIAMTDDLGIFTLVMAILGIGLYLFIYRIRPERVAPLVSVSFLPFFVYALYSGQRPLHVKQINGNLYNVRFGLVMVIAAAIFVAVLVGVLQRLRLPHIARILLPGVILAVALYIPFVDGVMTLSEARSFRSTSTELDSAAAATWLRHHYDGGKVLMESFGNETVTFESHIPTGQIIYEGSFRRWEPALEHPGQRGIRWIYMRSSSSNRDDVWSHLYGSQQLSPYRLVYEDTDRLIYELSDRNALPAIPEVSQS